MSPGIAGGPFAVIGRHCLLACLSGPGAGIVVICWVVLAMAAAQLPRTYWISCYIRLIKKGAALATAVEKVRHLMSSSSAAEAGCLGLPAEGTETILNVRLIARR
jgi:hypothetical protein